jgi:hypothetical protein
MPQPGRPGMLTARPARLIVRIKCDKTGTGESARVLLKIDKQD